MVESGEWQDQSRLAEHGADSSPAGISKDELDKLKLDSLSAINDTLFKKLSDIEQVGWTTNEITVSVWQFIWGLVRW